MTFLAAFGDDCLDPRGRSGALIVGEGSVRKRVLGFGEPSSFLARRADDAYPLRYSEEALALPGAARAGET